MQEIFGHIGLHIRDIWGTMAIDGRYRLVNERSLSKMTTPPALGLLPEGLGFSAAKLRLYETALRLFAENGYHAVGLRDVADELGQQPSSIYFHVDSKAELLFDLCLIGHQAHYESLRDALMDAGREPEMQLRGVITAHILVHLEYPSMARLTNRELRALDPEQLAEILTIRNAAEQIVIDVIERGMRMGAFQVDDAFLAARAILGMAVRLPEWLPSSGSERSPEQILDHYVTFALKVVR